MDLPLPVVSDDGDLQWSDSRSIDSDDVQSVGLPSPWLAGSFTDDSTSVSGSSSTMGYARTGQLSPISNALDMPCGPARRATSLASLSQSPPSTAESQSASTLSLVQSATRALRLSASDRAFTHPHAAASHGAHRRNWRRGADEGLAIPKSEALDDDDFCMDDLKEPPSPLALSPGSIHLQGQAGQKRPRGRPRKHPLMPNNATNKITKGRSKTGCLTCRKRKKKCDEARPRCMNCEKNAVVCEGYPEKQIWKSGKERAEEERLKSGHFPSITMYPLFPGLETVEDRVFWKHYNEHLSSVLTVESEHKNAFKDLMIPIAIKHQGLMHSILSLASKHIDFETPYGIGILRKNPGTTVEALRARSLHHHDQARLKFYHDIESTNGKSNIDDRTLVSARYGQMLCFLLEALVEGSPRGEHRLHLTVYRNLNLSSPPNDSAFMSFIAEVFQYYNFADELIYSATNRDAYSSLKPLPPLPPIHTPRLLGVADGLLGHLPQITAMRNIIRDNMLAHIDPAVSYPVIYPAEDIDAALRGWSSHWPPGDSRDRVTQLYRQMMWIYLHRTVYPPSFSAPPSMTSSVASASSLIHSSPSHGRPAAAPSVVDTPPHSASASCASSPKLSASSKSSRPLSRTGLPSHRPHTEGTPGPPGAGAESGPATAAAGAGASASASASASSARAESPPPLRQPSNLDAWLVSAVDESLALLESFKPGDPCQTLLLLPCFLVGTACFSRTQQARLRAAARTVRGYTGLRNADRVAEVLGEVWRLMEAGDWAAAWDWPGVAKRLGLDFIPA
ncbi:hypothetical protein N658DRAFT_509353 [Parathielavia hyrcaniae]|uniref:Zn(2)-C6 fungal-type domain-containing protein n=1 Tax=Parathielavia hyrcaniae TaxID=113614 RepID=A0AAN6PVI0_9PEZI|nr:hypothetical protein N658DRAFT_509353 [Parathielavia hyrcaniae]